MRIFSPQKSPQGCIVVVVSQTANTTRRVILSITQEMRYRLSAIKCAEGYGVKLAAVKCHTSPASIYRWRKPRHAGNGNIP